ncbi:MAG: regulatory protein RecX [Gemmatimonadetes bacterium]|nr:regulatory protein RecX [Gemmatimonadota bacterium]MBT6149453.1 regulatory protein RecX [Gemmatimonadota bacterium]MBT7862916.1 regulatory protein RecX [Gemmatimonadota bacterium]
MKDPATAQDGGLEDDLEDAESEEIQPKDVEKTRRIALDLLAVRDRTVKEMGERLERRECKAKAIATVMEGLCRTGLLDDVKYVRQWIGSRLENRPEGRIKLMQDLRKRGIDPSLAEQILEEFEDRVGTDDAADRVLDRVRHRYARLPDEAARRRMYGLLARRGFDPETARVAVERALAQLKETTAP